MKNEELILQMLRELKEGQSELVKSQYEMAKRQDVMQGSLDRMESRLDAVESRLDAVESRQDTMQTSLDTLSTEVRNIKLHLENETDKNIRIIAEQYQDNYDIAKNHAEKINLLVFDVDSLKRVVQSHSTDINKIKKEHNMP